MKAIFRNSRGSLLISGGTVLALLLLAVTIAASAEMVVIEDINPTSQEERQISNAMVIVSCAEANNALADVDEYLVEITYEDIMSMTTVDEFNAVCEIEISGMTDDDFNAAKTYIVKELGYLAVIGYE